MTTPADVHPTRVILLVFVCAASTVCGCTRTKYRLDADRQSYHVIAERNCDPRWTATDYAVDLDPRSRYFDPYDPDRPPMPQDDPASHDYMHRVNGMKGWKHWHDYGERFELENPAWREVLAEYMETTEAGAVKLDVDSAIKLAYVHSPTHQFQLETLYLSALDVTAERFRLRSQFFGGNFTEFTHDGALRPESSVLTTTNDLSLSRRFPTAGTVLVSVANSFTWEFTQGDFNFASSILSGTIVQPLLRGAGRDIALEQLTFQERTLLANLRAYSQFRQGFYTQVAIGELGVSGPQRFGSSTSLQSFSGQGGVNGYLGLLQQLQQIRNTEDNLSLQLRTLDRLEALYDNELIDLVQLDQFRQNVEAQRSELLVRQNALELALDNYKTGTLGLPPHLLIELDQRLIGQFQLIPRESSVIQDSLLELQGRLSRLPADPTVDAMNQVLDDCFRFVEPVRQLVENTRADFAQMDEAVPTRERTMTDKEKQRFREDREQLHQKLVELEQGDKGFNVAVTNLEALREGLSEQTRSETLRGVTAWLGAFLQVAERLSLVPAQARLEVITVDPVGLGVDEAFQVALANRLDFMNGRASLVDRWRQIAVTADALQSNLTVSLSGDLRTAGDNPAAFDGRNSTGSASLTFDAPLTRLLERNRYRESLITYQRGRREFIQSRDSLHLGLRALLRNLEQLRQNLEIQRRAVTIAMRRVDQTQLELTQPRPPAQPGVRPFINPTTAINLLSAQGSLQSTQNNFLAAWLSYYATRMRLYRELGIMVIDPDGRWIEYPIPAADGDQTFDPSNPFMEELPPPQIPADWIELMEVLERNPNAPPPVRLEVAASPN